MIALRLTGAVVLLLAGFATAVAAVAVHTTWWGLPLTAVALLSALHAVGRGLLTRVPLALGYAVGVGWAVVPAVEGGYVIAAATQGWLLLLSGLLAPGYALVTVPRLRQARQPATVAPPA